MNLPIAKQYYFENDIIPWIPPLTSPEKKIIDDSREGKPTPLEIIGLIKRYNWLGNFWYEEWKLYGKFCDGVEQPFPSQPNIELPKWGDFEVMFLQCLEHYSGMQYVNKITANVNHAQFRTCLVGSFATKFSHRVYFDFVKPLHDKDECYKGFYHDEKHLVNFIVDPVYTSFLEYVTEKLNKLNE